jgi:glutaredoxin
MKRIMPLRMPLALALVAAAGVAAAQQLYRWTDEKGRVHVTDTPPPASARDVRKVSPASTPAAKPDASLPFVLQQAMKDYPVTLYTAPSCQDPCAKARDYLNKRGVPFREVQVWEEAGAAELKQLTGVTEVPAVKVGASAYSGYHPDAYGGLLDSAGYRRRPRSRSSPSPSRPPGRIRRAARAKGPAARAEATPAAGA